MGYQPYTEELNEIGVTARKSGSDRERWQRLKRATDIILASAALIFLLPVLVPIACVIKLSDGGPALYFQKRIGRGGRVFDCLKFRTMVVDAQQRLDQLLDSDPIAKAEWETSRKLRNDPRITVFGNFLRKSSLDELPQLLNIIRGDMSIVGPRPMLTCEVDMYGDHFDLYCSIRPGLTGPWQVSGRSNLSYDTRVEYTVQYVREWTYLNDFVIIARTIPAVLNSRGAT